MCTENGRFSKDIFERRARSLAAALAAREGGFEVAFIVGRVNMYWLAGTMQDGIISLRPDGSVILWARRSFERARDESPLADIRPMRSYRDLLEEFPARMGRCYLDGESMTLAMLERMKKYLTMEDILPLDAVIARLRAVKEPGEIALMREAGRRHAKLLDEVLPTLLVEGMSEAELGAELYRAAVALGHQGLMRVNMFQTEIAVAQIGFGTNSLYPTAFDGPGGMVGLHPAAPVLGSRDRLLKRGDLVFADMGFGYCGYHSDKTRILSFGAEPPEQARAVHEACRTVLSRALELLKPGTPCAAVWDAATKDLPSELHEHFMGYAKAQVGFLGHGVGLHIDEPPVIMPKSRDVLEEGMVIALEPKSGIQDYGMVGVEETSLITPDGPECLTGGDRGLEESPCR